MLLRPLGVVFPPRRLGVDAPAPLAFLPDADVVARQLNAPPLAAAFLPQQLARPLVARVPLRSLVAGVLAQRPVLLRGADALPLRLDVGVLFLTFSPLGVAGAPHWSNAPLPGAAFLLQPFARFLVVDVLLQQLVRSPNAGAPARRLALDVASLAQLADRFAFPAAHPHARFVVQPAALILDALLECGPPGLAAGFP